MVSENTTAKIGRKHDASCLTERRFRGRVCRRTSYARLASRRSQNQVHSTAQAKVTSPKKGVNSQVSTVSPRCCRRKLWTRHAVLVELVRDNHFRVHAAFTYYTARPNTPGARNHWVMKCIHAK